MSAPRALNVIPAIDLRGGRCVRLLHGNPSAETRYEGDPVERARQFAAAGATRLHVVDLDGAFGTGDNLAALGAICRAVDIPVQSGGGVRTLEGAMARLDAGARYVIIGTLPIERPEQARELIASQGERIIAGVDARGNQVAIRGWATHARIERDPYVLELANWGVQRIIYTEIARDGAGTGYDVAALAHVAALSPMRVTASGGARTAQDLRALLAGTPANVDAAIVGRAIYEGSLDLAAAVAEFGSAPANSPRT